MQPLGRERRLCTAESCTAPWEVKMGITKMGLLALRRVPGAAPRLEQPAYPVVQCTPPGGGQWHVQSRRVKLCRGNQHVAGVALSCPCSNIKYKKTYQYEEAHCHVSARSTEL